MFSQGRMPVIDLAPVKAAVVRRGWAALSPALASTEDLCKCIKSVGSELGSIVPGRGKRAIEPVVPQTTAGAYAGSLSSKYGLGVLPLHTDTAHWTTPCRYLVIGCADVGPVPTPTLLLDVHRLALSEREAHACERAPFLISNGRRSFYGSVRDSARPFFRFDPGCMVPLTAAGQLAMEVFGAERNEASLDQHDWSVGDILIIDNWRMLHGRGRSQPTAIGRTLLRAMIR